MYKFAISLIKLSYIVFIGSMILGLYQELGLSYSGVATISLMVMVNGFLLLFLKEF